jgi:hypothetical protein
MKRAVFIICLLFVVNLGYSQEEITIKKGESKTLSSHGGSGKIVKWYSGSCGGTLVGTGEKITITPTKTTTYYGRWEKGEKVSDCQMVTIIVAEEPEPVAPIIDTISIRKDTIVVVQKDTIVIVQKDTLVVPQPPSTSPHSSNTKQYSFGKYVGSLRNGIPEGNGTLTYSRRVQIAKHDTVNPPHYAEAGDKFDGSWGNGDIVSGTLYGKDGMIKEKILAPKRYNAYDISND